MDRCGPTPRSSMPTPAPLPSTMVDRTFGPSDTARSRRVPVGPSGAVDYVP